MLILLSRKEAQIDCYGDVSVKPFTTLEMHMQRVEQKSGAIPSTTMNAAALAPVVHIWKENACLIARSL